MDAAATATGTFLSQVQNPRSCNPNPRPRSRRGAIVLRWLAGLVLAGGWLLKPDNSTAEGTWTALSNLAPQPINTMLLLSDGTVMAAGANQWNDWYRLTPDSQGNYANGTWSTRARMHYTRLYYSSDVLTDGRLFVAGAEYGTGTNSAEVYNPVTDSWTDCPPPPAGQDLFFDSVSKILPDGNVLISPVGPATFGGTVIYVAASNSFISGPKLFRGFYQDEASWVKLADDSILTIDPFGTNSERYIPSLNQWINDANVPVRLYDAFGGELGAAFLLPDGRAFYLGATGKSAIYTPSGGTNMGSWQPGPVIPNNQGTPDAPAAMMVNGLILCAVSPVPTAGNHFPSPTSFYEYDSVANSFTQVSGPTGVTYPTHPYIMRMLDLPDGSVLLAVSDDQLYLYRPGGTPVAAGKPAISDLVPNADGSFHLTGTLFNGISEGAGYGDDVQMDSNYPLVRMTHLGNGSVYYARTYGWSSTSVMTSNRVVTTEFALPAGLPGANYSVVVVANGNSSDPVTGFFTLAPVVIVPPQSQTVSVGSSATLTVTAAGVQPLGYQWRLDGANIPGATASAYNLAAASLANAGDYSVVVNNSYGAATSAVATLTVLSTIPLAVALNTTNLNWSTDAAAPWYGQANTSHDGFAAAQSWPINAGQQTTFRTTVTGPGTFGFWWKVSSSDPSDSLKVGYGGVAVATISNETDWTYQRVFLPTGNQTVEWAYAKNTNSIASGDGAWVDQVTYTPGSSGPVILIQPADQSSIAGSPVSFNVLAGGTPTLSYQWRLNGSDIPGATASTLAVASPRHSDEGAYSVRVFNGLGSIISSNAFLGVVPILWAGDNTFGQTPVSSAATGAVAIAAGAWHSIALRANGSVVAWGYNFDHECDVPPGLADAVAIAAGGYHSLALRVNQRVVGWGANYYGEASPPASLTNAIAVAAGTWHSLALRADGTVTGWGDNSAGQISIPPGLTNVIVIAAGGNHSLALRADGVVAAWGENTDSHGDYKGQSTVPASLGRAVAIAAGEYHSLAVQTGGVVVAWGDNSEGQSQPPPLLNGVAVAGGGVHSLAIKPDGTVAAWGANWDGQCNFPADLANAIAISAGNSHSLALLGNSSFPAPQLLHPQRAGALFSVLLQTFSGLTYTLQYKNSLADPAWSSLTPVPGNGAMQFFIDRTASNSQRIYRVGVR